MITWSQVLSSEKQQPYFVAILQHVENERRLGKTVYPPKNNTFEALRVTPLEQVAVVILGQDPYHGPNQAHGLAFSVQPPVPAPPSLRNVFLELQSDLGLPIPQHGDLTFWAKQGVLLLNTTLTVEHGKAGSHSNIGWERFTDRIISCLSEHQQGLIFLLWGAHARKKKSLINTQKHFVLEAPHPSPLSAHRGFLGCKHFSKTNELLARVGRVPIDWNLG